jgi:hypothetical protein
MHSPRIERRAGPFRVVDDPPIVGYGKPMARHGLRLRGLLAASLLAPAVVLACSGASDGSGFGNDNGNGNNGNGSGNGDGGSGTILGGGKGGSGPVDFDAACASSSSKGQQAPLDIYIMLDQSGSMNQQNKWPSVTSAINAFVQQPLQGVSVGIQYFAVSSSGGGGGNCTNGKACTTSADCGSGTCVPVINLCACSGGGPGNDSCNAADYAKPEVEIAPLPGVASQISASLSAHSPSSGTPTSAALQGAIDHATAWEGAHAGHVTVVLFATDGDPEECDTNLADIDAIAQKAANGNPKILTFVIGVGSSLSNLNGIAQAGGTGQAYLVDTNANAQQQFLDALNKIRGTALGCSYSIPVPTTGTPDYGSINVEYTPGSGGPPQIIPQVPNKGACPASGNAWYYDNPGAPTQIILCDATCNTVLGDKNGEVDVLLGCATVVK